MIRVLFSFGDKTIKDAIEDALIRKNVQFESVVAESKLEFFKIITQSEDIDCAVIMEGCADESSWTSRELSRLADGRDVNIVPILTEEHEEGSDYLQELYASGIMSALIGGVRPSEVAEMIVNPRERKDAKRYYGLSPYSCINNKGIEKKRVDRMLAYITGVDEPKQMAERFDDVCFELNREQIEFVLKRCNANIKNALKYSNIYTNLNSKKTKYRDIIEVPEFKHECSESINVVYGFDNDGLVDKLEELITSNGRTVKSDKRYTKKGILNMLSQDPTINTVIVVENLERQGAYKVEELIDIKEEYGVNLIVFLTEDKVGSEYINKLYCAGIYTATPGQRRFDYIYDLVINGRTRQQARECYGLDFGGKCGTKLPVKYKKSIVQFLELKDGDFYNRVSFLSRLIKDEEVKDVLDYLPAELKEKVDDTEIFLSEQEKKKRHKKREKEAKKTQKSKKNSVVEESVREEVVAEESVHAEETLKTAKPFISDFKSDSVVDDSTAEDVVTEKVDISDGNAASDEFEGIILPDSMKDLIENNEKADDTEKESSIKESDIKELVTETNSSPQEEATKNVTEAVEEPMVEVKADDSSDYKEEKIIAKPQKVQSAEPKQNKKPKVSKKTKLKAPSVDLASVANKITHINKKILISSIVAVLLLVVGIGFFSRRAKVGEPESLYAGENVVMQGVGAEDLAEGEEGRLGEIDLAAEETTEEELAVIESVDMTEEQTEELTEELTEEQTTEETTTQVETTSRIKKKKKKKVEQTTNNNEISTVAPTTRTEKQTKKKEKATKPKKEKTTKPKVVNTVPKQSENTGGLDRSSVNLIKNTIMSNFLGSYNGNMENLARYMANNGNSDAQGCINRLCQNTTLKVSGNIATVTANSDNSEDILAAASKLADSLAGSGTYGVGICVHEQNGKYKITAAIAVQMN
ncbi:MAG: hypothetical protein K6G88_11045 [Lachnospiraceae bacterium]|nr:hypothetical protein [Lachnospiraceae bacterium]